MEPGVSRAELPDQPGLYGDLAEARAAASSDYDCVTVFGPLPDSMLDDVAGLHRSMSTDVPTGSWA